MSSSSSSSPPTYADEDGKRRQAVPRREEEEAGPGGGGGGGAVDQSMYASAVDSVDKLSLGGRGDRLDTISANVLDREDIYMDDDDLARSEGGEAGPQWVWLSAGSCRVDPVSGPPGGWFLAEASSSSQLSLSGEPWRVSILQGLREKNEETAANPAYKGYHSAIERTAWVKKLGAKFHSGEARAK